MSENNTPWTPGAWDTYCAPSGEWVIKATYRDEQGRRCHAWPAIINPISGLPVEANARLIAAAPEMAKLLERHLYGHSRELNDRTHALLSRIRGESA